MTQHSPLSLLQWQHDMGVDEAVPEKPMPMHRPIRSVDEQMQEAMQALKGPGLKAPATPAPLAAPNGMAISGSLAESMTEAQNAASTARNVAELKAAVEAFEGCGLKRTAKNTVFGDGNSAAKLLLLGEAPGEDEDRQGIPFCGRSGQLLDRMMQSIGLDRATDYYISNSIYWRPPGNRTPNTEELALCRPFVQRLIALMQPTMIVLVGGIAAKSVLQTDATVGQLRRGSPNYESPGLPPIPTRVFYHPAYLLRTPAQKAVAWKDLQTIRQTLEIK